MYQYVRKCISNTLTFASTMEQYSTHKAKAMQDNAPVSNEQAVSVTDARIRGLTARKTLESIGVTGNYMGLIDLQAKKEGVGLTREQKVRCRQLLNGNLTIADIPLLELVERAIETAKKAFA